VPAVGVKTRRVPRKSPSEKQVGPGRGAPHKEKMGKGEQRAVHRRKSIIYRNWCDERNSLRRSRKEKNRGENGSKKSVESAERPARRCHIRREDGFSIQPRIFLTRCGGILTEGGKPGVFQEKPEENGRAIKTKEKLIRPRKDIE